MNQLAHVLRTVGKQIGFRAALISILAVVLALLAAVLAPLIPYDLSIKIGADAVDNILTILASSMLAVTTFSMTAMVTAFNGSAQNVTPRATQLLIEDSAAQNALSTFLGGFVFGIVGIIALSTGWYGSEGRVVLFAGTVLMIAWIVITLLRWIQRLTTFGRMEDTIERVEAVTQEAIERHPGAIRLVRSEGADGGMALRGQRVGYVLHIDAEAIAQVVGGRVEVVAPPGTFVDPSTDLLRLDRRLDIDARERVCEAFTIGNARDFHDDPRFGFIVLSEIASRALSPAVNDPGSAIATLAAGHRLAHGLLEKAAAAAPGANERVDWPISIDELLEDLLRPIARDGAALAEVQMRLQRLVGSVALRADALAPAMREMSDYAMAQVDASTMIEADRARVRRARERAFHHRGDDQPARR